MHTRAVRYVAVCIVILFLNNCVFLKLKEDLELVEKNTAIGGEIKNRSPEGFPVEISTLNATGDLAGVATGTAITLADDRFSNEIACKLSRLFWFSGAEGHSSRREESLFAVVFLLRQRFSFRNRLFLPESGSTW